MMDRSNEDQPGDHHLHLRSKRSAAAKASEITKKMLLTAEAMRKANFLTDTNVFVKVEVNSQSKGKSSKSSSSSQSSQNTPEKISTENSVSKISLRSVRKSCPKLSTPINKKSPNKTTPIQIWARKSTYTKTTPNIKVAVNRTTNSAKATTSSSATRVMERKRSPRFLSAQKLPFSTNVAASKDASSSIDHSDPPTSFTQLTSTCSNKVHLMKKPECPLIMTCEEHPFPEPYESQTVKMPSPFIYYDSSTGPTLIDDLVISCSTVIKAEDLYEASFCKSFPLSPEQERQHNEDIKLQAAMAKAIEKAKLHNGRILKLDCYSPSCPSIVKNATPEEFKNFIKNGTIVYQDGRLIMYYKQNKNN